MNIPYVFEAGNKAKAEEVNENFQAVSDKLEEQANNILTVKANLNAQIESLNTSITNSNEEVNKKFETVNDSLGNLSDGVASIFEKIAPKYSSGININNGWIATNYGWINWNSGAIGDGSTARLCINDVEVGLHSYYKYGDVQRLQYMVSKGDKVTFTNKTSAKFFPCKGDVKE